MNEYILGFGYYVSMILLGGVIMYGFYIYKREQNIKVSQEKMRQDSLAIVAEAQKKAESIVDEAITKTKAMLTESQVFHEDVEKQLRETLKASIDQYIGNLQKQISEVGKSYEKMASSTNQQFIAEAKDTFNHIKQVGDKELKDFESVMDANVKGTEAYIKEKVDLEFTNAQKEVQAYKEAQFKQIDQAIGEMVVKVSEKVMGQAISIDEHHKLIIKALEEAKESGFFTV